MRVIALGRIGSDGATIDPSHYSRFKYGQAAAIDDLGGKLAQRALDELPALVEAPVTVTAPAFRGVPIGADLLADRVLRRVNHARTVRLHEPAVRAKLHRYHIPEGDYGTKDLAARQALLSGERISSIPSLFTDRHILVVDDLWVTGTSAEVTAAVIASWRPASVSYLVVARVDQEYADHHPEVEAQLNHAAVDGLSALTDLLRGGPVIVTQRLCKFVMSQPPGALRAWLCEQQPEFIWRLYHACMADGFGQMAAFRESFSLLLTIVDRDQLDACAATEGWIA